MFGKRVPESCIKCAAFDSDGNIITGGYKTYSHSGYIGIWKLIDGKYSQVSEKILKQMGVYGIAVSPCRKFLVAVIGSMEAVVIDMDTWVEKKCLYTSEYIECFSATFSESGEYLVLSVGDGVQVFSSPDMTFLYDVKYKEGTLRRLYGSAGNVLEEYYCQRRDVVFSPSGEEWAVKLAKGVEIRKSITGELIRFIEYQSSETGPPLPEGCYRNDYQLTSPLGFTVMYSRGFDQLIYIIHTESQIVVGWIITKKYLESLALDRSGRYLAAVSEDLKVHDLYQVPVIVLDSIVCSLTRSRLSDPRIFSKIREYIVSQQVPIPLVQLEGLL